jgi:hypothetical protein
VPFAFLNDLIGHKDPSPCPRPYVSTSVAAVEASLMTLAANLIQPRNTAQCDRSPTL